MHKPAAEQDLGPMPILLQEAPGTVAKSSYGHLCKPTLRMKAWLQTCLAGSFRQGPTNHPRDSELKMNCRLEVQLGDRALA
jgi:hypothetical protein